ncbi:MAG: diadenylate cyclase CdaA [Leptolyngbyaceae bacterium]|nr:diadenylate cyclase CdaA [Leptolyngbyaceae bacterium]
MGSFFKQWLTIFSWTQSLLVVVDFVLVAFLIYVLLLQIRDRRTFHQFLGLVILVAAAGLSRFLALKFLAFVLNMLVIGSAVAMGLIFQAEFRRFLEHIGRGNFLKLFRPSRESASQSNDVIDEIVDAIKELSQNRTGALLILETDRPIDERDFSVPGVRINAEVSRELLQTIFQTTTLLHDGAVLIRDSRIMAAGVILPISERDASRQLGTRHRAAMGITERVDHCLCIVVSEETGSISIAERGLLNRPLTSSKLREMLRIRFSRISEREAVSPKLRGLWDHLISRSLAATSQLIHFCLSLFQTKKR